MYYEVANFRPGSTRGLLRRAPSSASTTVNMGVFSFPAAVIIITIRRYLLGGCCVNVNQQPASWHTSLLAGEGCVRCWIDDLRPPGQARAQSFRCYQLRILVDADPNYSVFWWRLTQKYSYIHVRWRMLTRNDALSCQPSRTPRQLLPVGAFAWLSAAVEVSRCNSEDVLS